MIRKYNTLHSAIFLNGKHFAFVCDIACLAIVFIHIVQ